MPRWRISFVGRGDRRGFSAAYRIRDGTYYIIATAEASANLARFDGVRYGHRAEHPQSLLDHYSRTRAEGFGRK